MRRFTSALLAMLAGLVLAPACGALIGIDTDRELRGETSSSSTSTSSSSGSTSSGVTPDAGPGACSADCTALAPRGTCAATNACAITCAATDLTCLDSVLQCPPDHDCVVKCSGKSCNGMTCNGGRSCTFDCVDADCEDTTCNSEKCSFQCGVGNSCAGRDDEVACGPSVRTCDLKCTNPEASACKKGIHCCATATTQCPSPSLCP